jgi:hypothetical protein
MQDKNSVVQQQSKQTRVGTESVASVIHPAAKRKFEIPTNRRTAGTDDISQERQCLKRGTHG